MAAATVYQTVTDRIIAALEKGTAPWVRPWANKFNGVRYQPHNMSTGKNYAGVNVLALSCAQLDKNYCSGAWATYKQIAGMGGQVRKGEKSTEIVYYETLHKTERDKTTGEEVEHRIPMLKTFNVFNLEQADGLNAGEIADHTWQDLPDSEETLYRSGAIINHGGNRAFYRPSDDFIQLPEKTAFSEAGSYYATAFHELTHWTGGKESRTPRTGGKIFGDEAYAFEELIAELGAAFLCARHEINGELQHEAYIANWLQMLKADPRAVFKAAAAAQRAVDYVMACAAQPVQIAA